MAGGLRRLRRSTRATAPIGRVGRPTAIGVGARLRLPALGPEVGRPVQVPHTPGHLRRGGDGRRGLHRADSGAIGIRRALRLRRHRVPSGRGEPFGGFAPHQIASGTGHGVGRGRSQCGGRGRVGDCRCLNRNCVVVPPALPCSFTTRHGDDEESRKGGKQDAHFRRLPDGSRARSKFRNPTPVTGALRPRVPPP